MKEITDGNWAGVSVLYRPSPSRSTGPGLPLPLRSGRRIDGLRSSQGRRRGWTSSRAYSYQAAPAAIVVFFLDLPAVVLLLLLASFALLFVVAATSPDVPVSSEGNFSSSSFPLRSGPGGYRSRSPSPRPGQLFLPPPPPCRRCRRSIDRSLDGHHRNHYHHLHASVLVVEVVELLLLLLLVLLLQFTRPVVIMELVVLLWLLLRRCRRHVLR